MSSDNMLNEVLEALSMNREIEFIYKNRSYALVYRQQGWCLVNRVENLSRYYLTNQELLNDVTLDGNKIEDLIRSGEISIDMIL